MDKKYIESEAAYRFAQDQLKKETGVYSKGWNNAMNVMKSAFHNNDAIPAADVVPVRHGRWINICGDRESPRQCSVCLQDFDYIDGICYLVSGQRLPQYCPNCGAKMDGDGNG